MTDPVLNSILSQQLTVDGRETLSVNNHLHLSFFTLTEKCYIKTWDIVHDESYELVLSYFTALYVLWDYIHCCSKVWDL